MVLGVVFPVLFGFHHVSVPGVCDYEKVMINAQAYPSMEDVERLVSEERYQELMENQVRDPIFGDVEVRKCD